MCIRDRITGTPRKVLEIISECLVLLLAAVVMLYGGVSIMKLTMTQVTASPVSYTHLDVYKRQTDMWPMRSGVEKIVKIQNK